MKKILNVETPKVKYSCIYHICILLCSEYFIYSAPMEKPSKLKICIFYFQASLTTSSGRSVRQVNRLGAVNIDENDEVFCDP